MSHVKILTLGIVILGFCGFTWGLSLSSRLVTSVCHQRDKFSASQNIQPAQKKAPPQKVPCGHFQSSKCSPDKTLRCDETPSFKFLPCDKSGRSVAATLRLLGAIAKPSLFITFKKSTTEVTSGILQKLSTEPSVNRETQRMSTIKALKEFSFQKQKDVIAFIKGSGRGDSVQVTSLWLTNQILVQNADLDLTSKLMENFPGDIAQVTEDIKFKLVNPLNSDSAPSGDEDTPIYGVEAIEADKVWAEGNKGEGVIVGIIDTGVRATHSFLKNNFIGGPKGWFDPYFGKEEPYDGTGHGTHTTGTIVATEKKIGVAPGSKFIHCAGCNDKGECLKSSIVKCFQWMICPSNRPGQTSMDDQEEGVREDEKCEGAPQVISNSWVPDQGEDEDINKAIKATAATGIILVFAAGNGGNECETVSPPSDLEEVISVGGTLADNSIGNFSGRGPFKGIKPDIVAPGEKILSVGRDSDDATKVATGTSFSTPHVSGTIALLLHEKPDLTLSQVKEILFKSAVPLNIAENDIQECGGVKQTEVPNNVWGHGLLNAYKAVQYLKENFKS